jgi:predicted amidohydrolase YtcJ
MQEAELLIVNGNIYTQDGNKNVEAIAIYNEKIIALGTAEDVEKYKGEKSKVIDAQGNFVMPGFIEGHGHFHGVGKSQMNLNFLKSNNWEEIVSMVEKKAKKAQPGEWIEGRGWHQEKWD